MTGGLAVTTAQEIASDFILDKIVSAKSVKPEVEVDLKGVNLNESLRQTRDWEINSMKGNVENSARVVPEQLECCLEIIKKKLTAMTTLTNCFFYLLT